MISLDNYIFKLHLDIYLGLGFKWQRGTYISGKTQDKFVN